MKNAKVPLALLLSFALCFGILSLPAVAEEQLYGMELEANIPEDSGLYDIWDNIKRYTGDAFFFAFIFSILFPLLPIDLILRESPLDVFVGILLLPLLPLGSVFKPSKQPKQNGREDNDGKKGKVEFLVAGSKAAAVFEFLEENFNQMAFFVLVLVDVALDAVRDAAWDNNFTAALTNIFTKRFLIVAHIG